MMYQCTPSEFDQQRGKYLFEMLRDLRCAGIEMKAKK